MLEALGWGALAASSLVIGSALAFARDWSGRQIGLVLAFGAGALISAIAFELALEGATIGDPGVMAVGLAAGALTYYVCDGLISRRGGRSGQASGGQSAAGPALALGAFLDGIPEQLVLGIGIASGEGVSVALLAAIFVSNLPEAIGSATDMAHAGTPRRQITLLWAGVALCCIGATVAGYLAAEAASANVQATIDGFAAGALLVMLIDTMIPDAAKKAPRVAGLAATLGFATAMGLSSLS